MISDRINKINPNLSIFVILDVWRPPIVDSSTMSLHHTRDKIITITTPVDPSQPRLPVRARRNPGRKHPSAIAVMALHGLGPGTKCPLPRGAYIMLPSPTNRLLVLNRCLLQGQSERRNPFLIYPPWVIIAPPLHRITKIK